MQSEDDISHLIDQLMNGDAFLYSTIRDDISTQPPPWGFSLHHVESVKAMHDNLNALAMIATFLAAVQAQVNTYTLQSNSTNLQVAVNAAFFLGLLLDVLGGCIAYIVAVQLQHIHALLLRRTTSISQVTSVLERYSTPPGAIPSISELKIGIERLPSICLHIRFLEVIFLHALNSRSAWDATLLKVQECRRLVDEIAQKMDKRLHANVYMLLQEYQNTTEELEKSRSHISIVFCAIAIIRVIVFGGVLSLIFGLLCYVKDVQPAGVWITLFTVLGGIFSLFVVVLISCSRS